MRDAGAGPTPSTFGSQHELDHGQPARHDDAELLGIISIAELARFDVPATMCWWRCRLRDRPASMNPWLAANSRTLSPLFSWAAISPRHLSSLVFVMPPIVAATPSAARWVYRALTRGRPTTD